MTILSIVVTKRGEQSRAREAARQTQISQTQHDSCAPELKTYYANHKTPSRRRWSLSCCHPPTGSIVAAIAQLPSQALATMMASSDAVEAAAYASKYRKYERDYLRRINHLYFSSTAADNSELFESVATIDGFVIKESKEAPLKKFLATSGLVNAETSNSKVEPMDIDINLPSTSNKKSQRATPDGNRKSSARGK